MCALSIKPVSCYNKYHYYSHLRDEKTGSGSWSHTQQWPDWRL